MEQVHGGDIYTYPGMMDFSANINPLGPSEAVVRAAQEAVLNMEQYPDPRCRKLRHALSGQLEVEADSLIFGNGAAELIFSLVMAERPGKAVLTAPSFAEYKQALKAVGCEVIYVPLDEADSFRLNEEYLDYLGWDIDMVFLCSPDNPTGSVIDRELLLKIVQRCQDYNIRMVMDECFYEFLTGWQEATLQRQAEQYSVLFILRAFTKMHAMPGLRLGYGICCDKNLLAKMELARQPWSVSGVAQAAGEAAVGEQEWVERARAYISQEREWMTAELARIGIRYYPPSANYIFLQSDYDLYEILKTKNILIRDCSNYEGLAKGHYRAAIRSREDNQKLIDALADICKDVAGSGQEG